MSGQFLSIKSSTWHRESHGLYDYESSNTTIKKLKIENDSYIVLNSDNKISIIPKSTNYEITSDTKFLLSVSKISKNYTIEVNKSVFTSKDCSYENAWLVLKDMKGVNGYTLSEGDTVRLGKMQLKIKEIKGLKSSRTSKSSISSKDVYQGGLGGKKKSSYENDSPLQVKSAEIKDNVYCRICLDEEDSDNVLISPCHCSGSMAKVHLKCLQTWLSSKIASRDNASSTCYSWKSLECELCKRQYPEKIQVNNSVYDLLLLKKPETNYIVLESLSEPRTAGKTVNVICFQDKKNIRLGRGHDSDIRLSDISVSRNHANIKLTSNGLLLDDISSKFGTLVKIKRPIVMVTGTKLNIQCGRSVLHIGLKKPFSFFSCFGTCNRHRDSDDEHQRHPKEITEESFAKS